MTYPFYMFTNGKTACIIKAVTNKTVRRVRMTEIGDRIRKYRKEKGMTQSALAERLGVSTQSVSKWETGMGMPDVSQIVPLARALGVSTDTLFDFTDRYKDINRRWQKACFDYESGRGSIEECVRLDEEALREFPDDDTFLCRHAVDKYRMACDTADAQKKADILLSAEGSAFWALSKVSNPELVYGILVKILAEEGKNDAAVEYAYKSKNKKTLLKWALTGDELRRHRQNLIQKKMQELISELQDSDDLDFLLAEQRLIEAFIPDGNYVWYYDYLSMIEVKRAKIYIRSSEHGKAAEAIARAFYLAKEKDERAERSFTVPVLDRADPERDDAPPLTEQIYSVCNNKKCFEPLRENEEYNGILADVRDFLDKYKKKRR